MRTRHSLGPGPQDPSGVWWKYPSSLGPPTAVFCKIRLDVAVAVFTVVVTVCSIAFFVLVPGDLSQPPPPVYGFGVILAPGLISIAIVSILERSPRFGQQFRIHRNGISESKEGKSKFILYKDVTHVSHRATDHGNRRFVDLRILSVDSSVRGTFSVVSGSRKEAAVLSLVRRLQTGELG